MLTACGDHYRQGGRAGKVLEAAEVDDKNLVRIGNAQLRYYLHIADPDSLSDEEWCQLMKELEWIRKKEAEHNK